MTAAQSPAEGFDPINIGADEEEIMAREKRESDSKIIQNHVEGIPAFTLLTTSQYVAVKRYVHFRFGLPEGTYIVNRYGLPFIPLPKPRGGNSSRRYIALPRSIAETRAIVHPIYWTAEEVLGDVPEKIDTPWAQEWSIRMFSFLMLCGLVSEDYTVKDYLAVNRLNVIGRNDDLDTMKLRELRAYIDASGAATAFDTIPYLTFDSIIVDPVKRGFETKEELYNDFADTMVAKCTEVLESSASSINAELTKTLARADEYLFQHTESEDGGIVFGNTVLDRYDAPFSQWSDIFGPLYVTVQDEFRNSLRTNGYQEPVQAPLLNIANGIEKAVAEMDNLSSVLIGPVMARDKELDEEAISALQSYNRMAVDTVSHSERFSVNMKDVLVSMDFGIESVTFNEDTPDYQIDESDSFDALSKFLQEHSDVYQQAWERLFLCRANYDAMIDGRRLYNSFEGAQTDICVNN